MSEELGRIEVTLRNQRVLVTDVEMGGPDPGAGIMTSYLENFRLRDPNGEFIPWEEELTDQEVEMVSEAVHQAEREYEERMAEARGAVEPDADDDPTLWCIPCGARTRKQCRCGPIAENE